VGKGQNFEREMAKKLSLWWSDGEDDSHFWRSSMSGGRATVRAKSGKSTSNSCGDLMAMTALGQTLLDITAFELKKGYNSYSIQDLFDKPNMANGFGAFIEQAYRDSSLAGCRDWTVVHKRDRREPIFVTSMDIPSFRIWVPSLQSAISVVPEHWFLTPGTKEIVKEYAINA
jgi:hypothetical protein